MIFISVVAEEGWIDQVHVPFAQMALSVLPSTEGIRLCLSSTESNCSDAVTHREGHLLGPLVSSFTSRSTLHACTLAMFTFLCTKRRPYTAFGSAVKIWT